MLNSKQLPTKQIFCIASLFFLLILLVLLCFGFIVLFNTIYFNLILKYLFILTSNFIYSLVLIKLFIIQKLFLITDVIISIGLTCSGIKYSNILFLNIPVLVNLKDGIIFESQYELEQRLIGALLGDGWLERRSQTSNARFRYEQSHKHEGRFFYLYYFCVFYWLGFPLLRERFDRRTNETYYTYHFSTRMLPFFVPFYLLFDPEGIKRVPSNIYLYLTPIALAQLIMDDGTWAQFGVVIQTNGFVPSDVEILSNAINTNFNLNSYLRFEKNRPVIYIWAKDIPQLKVIVLNHMHPSTHYKLGLK